MYLPQIPPRAWPSANAWKRSIQTLIYSIYRVQCQALGLAGFWLGFGLSAEIEDFGTDFAT